MNSEPDVDSQTEIEIANIVASGKLNVELDLAAVAEDLEKLDAIERVEHSRNQGNRLLTYFEDNDALAIISPNGVYVFTGANTHDGVNNAKEQLLLSLKELGIISGVDLDTSEVVDEFKIQNLVCTAELDSDKNLDLDLLAVGLGMENTEYEPEQFPGLIYRPSSSNCTILIFSSKKVVITGIDDQDTAHDEYIQLNTKLDEILS